MLRVRLSHLLPLSCNPLSNQKCRTVRADSGVNTGVTAGHRKATRDREVCNSHPPSRNTCTRTLCTMPSIPTTDPWPTLGQRRQWHRTECRPIHYGFWFLSLLPNANHNENQPWTRCLSNFREDSGVVRMRGPWCAAPKELPVRTITPSRLHWLDEHLLLKV